MLEKAIEFKFSGKKKLSRGAIKKFGIWWISPWQDHIESNPQYMFCWIPFIKLPEGNWDLYNK